MPNFHSGNIKATPLSEILEDLRRKRTTGTLTLRRGAIAKSIYLKDGRIIFAASADPRDRIGECLVRAGKLAPEKLEHAVRLFEKHAGVKKMGAILVENGFVPAKELFAGLKIQVNEIIFSLFLWPDGDYSFEDRLPEGVIQLPIDFRELITGILQRIKREV